MSLQVMLVRLLMALLSMWQASRNSDSVRIWDSDIVGKKNSNLPFELSIITESLAEESKTERLSKKCG